MELTTEDRERIEQEAEKYSSNGMDKFNFRCGAEYATIYEREKFDPHLPCVKENKRDLEKLTKKLQEHKAQKLSSLEKYQLERIEKLEAECSELIRRIKSILKASTVHDKISILEELEQLLNSLKTK